MLLLYVIDLVVIAQSKEEPVKKLTRWKDGLEGECMKVNISKTKVVISGESCCGLWVLW